MPRPSIPKIPHLPPPGGAVFVRLRRAVNGVGGLIASRQNRLPVSGLVTLSVIAIALVAYGGGALLASVTGPRVGAATAAAKLATPEKPARQGPALVSPLVVTPANVPSSEPAARAGSYMVQAKAGDPAAQYDVGVLYARGDGLVQDYASAFSWFHTAATQGNVAAQYNLGVLYAEGRGVPADQSEALNWYRSAADQNHPGAQFNLALAYAQGAGTDQDYAAAARWYERAARQGLTPAMINLAILYEQGNGVERSLIDAYAWYNVAAERGDAGGKQRAGVLFQQFSDRDRTRAQGLSATIAGSLDAAAPKSELRPASVLSSAGNG
jgi:TPR repeat protein